MANSFAAGQALLEHARRKGVRIWGAPAVVTSPQFAFMARAGRAGSSATSPPPTRLRPHRPGLVGVLLREGRRQHARPRRLQPDHADRPARPGEGRGRDDQHRHPDAHDREQGQDQGRGRGQRDGPARPRQRRVLARPVRLQLLQPARPRRPEQDRHTISIVGTQGRWGWSATTGSRSASTWRRRQADVQAAAAPTRRATSGSRARRSSPSASRPARSRSFTPEHALHVVEIMDAARASGEHGRRVELHSTFKWPLV